MFLRHLLRRLFRRCGCLAALTAGTTSLALAGGGHGVNVQVFGGHQAACFVQPQVAVQTFGVQAYAPQVQVATVAAPIQVATFATPVFVQSHCVQSFGHCGGVNVQAFGHSRARLFGGSRTVVRVRSR